MSRVWTWLWLVPFLYLPNLVNGKTLFGTLETSDFLVVPLLLLLLITPRRSDSRIYSRWIIIPLAALILWSGLSILAIYFRFDYSNPQFIATFSSLKLAKFTLYSFTGLFMASRITTAKARENFNWVLLACCLVISLSIFVSPLMSPEKLNHTSGNLYERENLVSITMAILIIYSGALLLTGTGTQRWRLACKLTLPVILLGFTLTRGRGGWVAAVAGFIYLGYKRGFLKVRTLTGIATVIMASSILYFVNTEFQEQVDRTLWPDKQYLQKNSFGIGGIDDGGRIITFEHEVGSFIKKPLLGAGFHHRGGLSGLTPSGSHNFWLQILLETGIVGFYLLILICFRMWKHSDVSAAKQQRLSLPLKSALFTTFIAGLGGEYFYGGIGLFTVFLIYASTGSLPRMNSQKNSIEKIKAA